MFDFFIVLFGGLFFLYKVCHEQSKTEQYDKEVADKKAYRDSLKERLCTTFEYERLTQERILSGRYYNAICGKFEEDFKYVFGNKWREILDIPTRQSVFDPKACKEGTCSFLLPGNHLYWVYRLMLADRGKVDRDMLSHGYPIKGTKELSSECSIGGIKEKDEYIKFAHCIENHLYKAGVNDIRLVLEQRDFSTSYGEYIKIESLCNYPTQRLW